MPPLANLRHFIDEKQRHQQEEKNNRPGPRRALEIQNHIGAQQSAVAEVQDLYIVFPEAGDSLRGGPSSDFFPVLEHHEGSEGGDIEELPDEIRPAIDAANGKDIENKAADE